MTDDLTKVHIDLPNHWAVGGESLWAASLGNNRYRVDNVPFYAYNVNYQDVVEAQVAAPDLKPSVLRVVERSGHQTLRVLFAEDVPEEHRVQRMASLAELHVEYERATSRLFALDVLPGANIEIVRSRLDEWERDGFLEYETCEARVPDSFDDAPEEAT